MLKLDAPTRLTRLDELLPPQLVARLSALDITSRKILAGKLKGERRSKRRGDSVEFADHRQYVVGDDLRHIDWNIFGRLDRMFMKLFLEEEDLSLHIVLDASGSHDCGAPSKWVFMQQLCAAIGFVGLANLHRLNVSAIGGLPSQREGQGVGSPSASSSSPSDTAPVLTQLRDLRGRRRLADLGRFLMSIEPGGSAPFGEACKRIAISRRGKGVMVVISDFFIKEGYDTGLRLLVGRGYDVYAVQVMSPQELKPDIGGDLRLKDCEDGDTAEVTISGPLLRRYEANLTAYVNRLRDFCARREIVHQLVPSSTPVDQTVLDYLRRKGLVR